MYAQATAESGLKLHKRWGRTTGRRGGTRTPVVLPVSARRSCPCPAGARRTRSRREVRGARTGGGAGVGSAFAVAATYPRDVATRLGTQTARACVDGSGELGGLAYAYRVPVLDVVEERYWGVRH